LTARGLDEAPLVVTGANLRDPWICFREEHLDVLVWLGSVATAVTLHRLGHDDLADRFIALGEQVDEIDAMSEMFGEVLEIANLPTRRINEPQNLDLLIEELFEFANALDSSASDR
jgi:hypothetical protein